MQNQKFSHPYQTALLTAQRQVDLSRILEVGHFTAFDQLNLKLSGLLVNWV